MIAFDTDVESVPVDFDADMHAVAADLELLATLNSAVGSTLDYSEWTGILQAFPPRVRRVVILHGLKGMTFPEIGERLGITRARCDQIWRSALPTLAGLSPQFRDHRSMVVREVPVSFRRVR